jgi:GTP-binding protein
MKGIVAIVGRPNVGKSTLFNALLRQKKAIVEDIPGVTRDMNFGRVQHDERSFLLIDTGGFEPEAKEGIAGLVRRQCELAVKEADLVLFVLDAKEGLNPLDKEIANYLRKTEKRVLYVINKVDGPKERRNVTEFYELGIERPILVSAIHRRGLDELLDEILKNLPEEAGEPEKNTQEVIKVAIVGRPNVGKSSLLNRILGFERVIVDERPGTTRDAIDTPFTFDGKEFLLIDTAGIRRKSRISQKLEWYCVWQAIKSIERADVNLLVLDAVEGPTDQDSKIANLIQNRGKGLILVVNKWDLAEGKVKVKEYEEALRERFHFLDFAPILFVSAKTGYGTEKILNTVQEVYSEWKKRIPTGQLNRWFRKTILPHQLPLWRNKVVKIYYLTQTQVAPPTFVLFVNYPEGVRENFQRFLIRKLREAFGFLGSPIRLVVKERE